MKTIFTIVAAFFLFAQTSNAQNGQGNEKIEALKIAFITKHLNLTAEESQKFWPVYNQYEAEKKQIRQSTIGSIKELKDDGDFTNAEADQAITKYIEFKSRDLDLTKKYIAEFKKILPSTKIAKLVTAEDRFKKMLAKQAQSGGANGPKPWKNK
ncbi:MAG: hypothetical protein U0U67_06005 [Chitinophagales bacterium]